MEKPQILEAIKAIKKKGPKKKFDQSIDLIVSLKDLDLKKPEHKIDFFVTLPFPTGKKVKICALVDQQLSSQAKKVFDMVIEKNDFPAWKDKKKVKKLAKDYDVFVAQAEIMTNIAATFGKVFGPKGKMPNPKAGCVVPGAIPDIQPLYDKLQKTAKLQTKNELSVKTSIGKESMSEDQLYENIHHVYDVLIKKLPQEQNNVKRVMFKLTMGQAYTIGKGFNHQIGEKKDES